MRKIFFILFMTFVAVANAQTIHWLTFIDTTDENVGHLDKIGRRVLYSRFIDVVNAALVEKGYKSDIQDYYDTRLSPQACKSAVEHLSCDPNDVVVFYYIGHGSRSPYDNTEYPQMLLGETRDESKLIPLSWVHQQLKSKNARLTVTIGMCCNVIQNISAKSAPTFSVNYGNTYLTDTEKNAIQKLFLQNTGDILISSASVGQSSIGGGTPFGDMDLFTAVWVSVFEEYASEGSLSWNSLFTDVRNFVNSVTNGQQTPIWTSNIRSASMPTKQTASEPKQVTKPTTSQSESESSSSIKDENLNTLSSYFDHLIDSNLSESERISFSQKFETLFTSNAIVRTMSQDGDVVVDKASADDFIGRLATSRILLKVIPISYTMSGDKLSELRVREVYKK